MLHDSARTHKLEGYLIGRLQCYECFLLLQNEQRSFEMSLNSGTRRGHKDSSETIKWLKNRGMFSFATKLLIYWKCSVTKGASSWRRIMVGLTRATLFCSLSRIPRYTCWYTVVCPASENSSWTDSKSSKTAEKSFRETSHQRQLDATSWQCTLSHCILNKLITLSSNGTIK